jgi:hypothetical protein
LAKTATWNLADEVLRLLLPLDCGADVGFVQASLDVDEDEALEALEALEAKRVVISGMVTSSAPRPVRCWRVA